MGGECETVVPSSKSKADKMTLGDIRVHEKDGEVHFHADSSGLKAAVPSGIWFQVWLRLMDQGGSFTFVDAERGTSVVVKVTVTDILPTTQPGPNSQVDASVSVSKIGVGDIFKALHEFTIRKR